MKAIIFDAFGTLIKVTKGNSAGVIMKHITDSGAEVEKEAFLKEWKAYYKARTLEACGFMTEREIFIARIQMFYDRYRVHRSAEADADELLTGAFKREAYPEVKLVLEKLMQSYSVFIGSNTDNDVLESVMRKNDIKVHKVYTSEDLKCYKPDVRFYQQILEENQLLPQEVIFVGDTVTDDILGPKALGINTVLIDRTGTIGELGQDATITDLSELLEKINDTYF